MDAFRAGELDRLDESGIGPVAYDEVEQVELTRLFLEDRERFLRHLLSDE